MTLFLLIALLALGYLFYRHLKVKGELNEAIAEVQRLKDRLLK